MWNDPKKEIQKSSSLHYRVSYVKTPSLFHGCLLLGRATLLRRNASDSRNCGTTPGKTSKKAVLCSIACLWVGHQVCSTGVCCSAGQHCYDATLVTREIVERRQERDPKKQFFHYSVPLGGTPSSSHKCCPECRRIVALRRDVGGSRN